MKTEPFKHSGVTVTLSKLSAPQRTECLILMEQQAEQAKSDSDRQVTAEDATKTGAFMAAMSRGIATRRR